MIDIHCHLLYGVDDGSKSLEESVEMLKIAKKQGITGIILTPPLRHGMFKHPLEKIERHYKKLMPYAKKLGIEIKLGTEYHVATDMIDAFHGGLCHTLADTQYILTEYSHSSEYSFVYKMTREAIFAGYTCNSRTVMLLDSSTSSPALDAFARRSSALTRDNRTPSLNGLVR